MQNHILNGLVVRRLGCLLLLFPGFLAGCSTSPVQRAAIEGEVTLGGQPLKAGRIVFTPLAPYEGPAASATIVDGRYQATQFEGPIVGLNQVSVEAEFDLGFSVDDDQAFALHLAQHPLQRVQIPPQFNHSSQLQTVVESGDENRFDIAIPGTAAAGRSAHE